MKINILLCTFIILHINGFKLNAETKLYKFKQSPKIIDSSTQTLVTIKNNGKTKQIIYPKKLATKNMLRSTSLIKKGVILSFGRDINIDIDNLENKYKIKFVKKLGISYYQFKNNSIYDDQQLILRIIADEKRIKDIRPNWPEKLSLY
ncbi:hypothetical protein MNB_ARC-1_405 [hydrothermal vent metagenome]|uniref:Uncharacterized protein n=1 Tax=hydrothermal vent metagenome TaxID=652676 RepID=A0A3B1DSZ7_9ZZZZ